MRSAILCAAVSIVAVLALAARSENKPDKKADPYAGHIAATPPLAPADERKAFHLPAGFEVQLVAAEPDIHKPLNLAFDDRGRLWVSETVEYPFAAAPGKKPRDAVKVLDDFGPDGRARKVTTFADGLNIPIGLLPLPATSPQEALVFSIPSIYRMRAGMADGLAGTRRVLYTEYGSRDTHGLTNAFTWGFDGWVYACHGFSNTSTIKAQDTSPKRQRGDGNSITMQSGNTYRIRADGSHIEQFTHGQVNPFGLSFDPLGNLYAADCHSQPIYQLLRGAYYPSFGKPHDGLGFAPEMYTGYTESTAVSGIAFYAADQFPPAWQGSAFVGDVVSHRVNQFAIQWHGSSPKGILKRFLESDDPWFRPVDVKLGPDGALYVADFYNRIIGHYEVPLTHPGRDRERGRIWRIVYRGEDHHGTPAPRSDWTKASIGDLIKDLVHPNLIVRTQAANQLVERGGEGGRQAVRDLLTSDRANAWQWMHGLWVLERGGALEDALLTRGAKHKDRGVRVHAQRVLSERATLTPAQHNLALSGLEDTDPNVQRAAADALGRHPAAENVRPLLDLRHAIAAVAAADTHLLHVVRMALRDNLLSPDSWPQLVGESWSERDAKAIADVSLGVPSAEAAAYLMHDISHHTQPVDRVVSFVHHIARHGRPPVTARLLDFVRTTEPRNLGQQVALFRAIEQGTRERGARLSPAVRDWAIDLTNRLLASKEGRDVQSGIELVGTLKLESQQGRLTEITRRRKAPEGQRKAALDALSALDAGRHAAVLGEVLADAESPFALREHSANLLARANQPPTQAELLKVLPTAPARLQNVIAAGLAGSRQGAEQLLGAVKAGKASARLLQDRTVSLRLKESRLPKWEERVAELTRGLPPPEKGMQDLLNRRRESFLKAAKKDATRGARVFTKNCAICHQLGGQGAKIGPQLDGIGARGLDRLLEDTLDPNRNVDQAFRLTTLNLKKGQVVSGLLLKEEGAVLVLADAQGKEVRVDRDTVDERSTSQMSPMPANFAEQVPEADFNDLLAYLLAQQSSKQTNPGPRGP